jgi:hypothetical protein
MKAQGKGIKPIMRVPRLVKEPYARTYYRASSKSYRRATRPHWRELV